MRVDHWNAKTLGPFAEEGLIRRFPKALFRVHLRVLEEPAMLTGSAPARTMVALEGSWLLQAGGEQVMARPGDLVDVPPGEFAFQCDGPVAYLAVYPLPPEQVLN